MGLIALLACTALASFGAGSGIQTIVVGVCPNLILSKSDLIID